MPEICTMGIDPTSAGAMGWATVLAGGLVEYGQVDMKDAPAHDEISRLDYQADQLAALLLRLRPQAVIIERAIINSSAVAKYIQGDNPAQAGAKITGATSRSIDVGIAVGVLLRVVRHEAGLPALLINPGAAKYFATGSVGAKKTLVQEAARMRVYQQQYDRAIVQNTRPPVITSIKRPSEHIAAAIFVALAGAHQLKMARHTNS